ncbi:MAG: o-succinylbenzoate synthase [Candidatus Aminicenantes bacterium]|nr:o-succinylbenzoate synthase [Candidatus Aminicenantes bacterium]
MSLDRIEMSLLHLPYVHYFETSFGREYDRTFLILRACADGVTGYGEVVAAASPLYSYETTETAWHVLQDFFIPLVFEKDLEDPADVARELNRYRGHPMARAGLELALWDLKAKKEGLSLSRLYGGTRSAIAAGVSIGVQDTPEELVVRIAAFLDEGYRRVKIKIKPGWDVRICEAIRKAYPDLLLQADANGCYSVEDVAHLRQLDAFSLLMLEQVFPPYDLLDHSRLQETINTPLCLDESITSVTTTRQALELKSCRIVNIKVGRVGGIVEALRIHDLCEAKNIPVWCGGMLESGVGRAHNIHLAALPNFVFPHDISASRRYYKEDIVEPPFDITDEGVIPVPDGPGIGVEVLEDRIQKATRRHKVLKPA